jgi:hypothetical protein
MQWDQKLFFVIRANPGGGPELNGLPAAYGETFALPGCFSVQTVKTADCQNVGAEAACLHAKFGKNGEHHLSGPLRIFPWTFPEMVGFLSASLVSCRLMLYLVRHTQAFQFWPLPILLFFLGIALAWVSLRQWRELHPVRCALMLGLCSGLAGSSAYYLFVMGFIRLLL